ncbi:hypothetical protein, variant 1 [Aphanomyces invadans]|uniref:5'-Nucleotidase C-terminal domain-containing protein n=1 Tax=Aphanomyces invadans TaxID=157072 RepID=A0A024USI6_9STRA|nr:hypothetical protein, variant 1 [Aphanomyces invadans]ETW09319.1 hypothetical protein, variant 1 [Aphanomyces invadans]|eukprot:XP_008863124.1 hypothetical protein, variant 1 [Aphanomyces invadans]
MAADASATLTFLTVNDVYDVVPNEQGRGGMAELATLLQAERSIIPPTHHTITTINGDFLSASQAGEHYKGAHMIDILNRMDIDYAVYGNHEFDFGSDVLVQRVAESNFQWFGSNVRDKVTGNVLGNGLDTVLFPVGSTSQGGVIQVGMFGICTPETPHLSFPGDKVEFLEIVDTSKRCVDELKARGADVIIALTHVSIAHDKLLAKRVPGIDVILGGHDHDPFTLYQGKTFIHKSGQNAYWLGRVDFVIRKRGDKVTVSPGWKMLVNQHVTPEAGIEALVHKYMAPFLTADRLEAGARQLAVLSHPLITKTSVMRGEESNFGNLVADAIRQELGAQFGLLNGGFVRGDTVHEAKTQLTVGMVLKEMPFPRPAVLLRIQGRDLKEAVEQHLRHYPLLAGSFPHVSGMRVTYDRTRETPEVCSCRSIMKCLHMWLSMFAIDHVVPRRLRKRHQLG